MIAQALRRRVRGEPLAYILGKTEFMGLEFYVSPEVLVPRQDTEVLVEAAIGWVNKLTCQQANKLKILEIGTGSGCIAVSLARALSGCRITATDISAPALEVAAENARKNKVSGQIDFIQNDLFPPAGAVKEKFDLIVSNPPYVRSADIAALEPEVRAEPRLALDGGKDGLDFFRRILRDGEDWLRPGGAVMAEMGYDQKEAVSALCSRSEKFTIQDIIKDYNGIDRVVVIGR